MAAKATKIKASGGTASRPRRASPKILQLIREHRQQSAIATKCWDKAEARVEELIRLLGPGRVVAVEDGVFCTIKDLFAETNAVYVPKVMKRYKLLICDANGKEIRLRDRASPKGKKTAAKTAARAKSTKGKKKAA